MVAPASNPIVRYAPEDSSMPPPWRALFDDVSGYVYYWNTETNETTYTKPSNSSGGALDFPAAPNNGRYQEHGSLNGEAPPKSESKLSSTQNLPPSQQMANGASYKRGSEAIYYSDRDSSKRSKTQPVSLDVEAYRKQHEITLVGSDVPPPFVTFDSAGFPAEVLRELQVAGFSAPTPIQAQSWPIALRGRDIVAIAKTGSGKTLGYLLPAFLHLERRRNNSRFGPTVLVLAPTRELATQIHDEAVKFGRSSRISTTCVYGGASKGPQLRDIERGCDIVIATPGRLNDFLEVRRVNLGQVSYLVLDEADRMLDMGFEPQIRKIVHELPPQRQTLMYTATWPKEVRKIAADLLSSPVQVNIGNTDDLAANKAITQCVEVVSPHDKSRRLEQILRNQEPGSKIIIFCSTKRMCDQLAHGLRRDFGAVAIHGDKSQNERDWVLTQFKTGKSPVLVATDVAARGLDIKDIRVVINYDFPTGVEDYVHRIGRTGRAGATGLAHTFFAEQDGKYARDLIKVLEGANQKVPGELRDMAARGFYGKARNRWEPVGRAPAPAAAASMNGYGAGAGAGGGGYGGARSGSYYMSSSQVSSRSGSRGAAGSERDREYGRSRYGESRKRSYSRSRSRSPNVRNQRSRRSSPPHHGYGGGGGGATVAAAGSGNGSGGWHW